MFENVQCEDAAEETEPSPHEDQNILIVEDDPGIQFALSRVLSRIGYQVSTASNGPEALEFLAHKHDKVDLLLTDITMPGGMDGLDVATETLIYHPDSSVLFMSGYPNIIHNGTEIEIKKDCFLQKPFSIPDLIHSVELAMENHGTIPIF